MSCCMNWRRTDGGNERREEGIIIITRSSQTFHAFWVFTNLSICGFQSIPGGSNDRDVAAMHVCNKESFVNVNQHGGNDVTRWTTT